MANLDCQCDYIWNQLEQPWVPLWGISWIRLFESGRLVLAHTGLGRKTWCPLPTAFILLVKFCVPLLVLEPASSGRLKPSSSLGTLRLQSCWGCWDIDLVGWETTGFLASQEWDSYGWVAQNASWEESKRLHMYLQKQYINSVPIESTGYNPAIWVHG